MRKRNLLSNVFRAAVLLAGLVAVPVWGANVVSVSNGTTTAEYATIESALEACSGGETLTLLSDVTVTAGLAVTKPVAVDLAGHTLRNTTAQFIRPTAAADGLSFRNGTIDSADCNFYFGEGSYKVSVSNVTFTGIAVLYGNGGTLEFLDGCLAQTRTCFVSSWSNGGCGCNVRGGVVACGKFYDNASYSGTKLSVSGGSFVIDPSAFVAADSVLETQDHTALGVACHYFVRAERPEDAAVASVTHADGSTTYFKTMVAALNECASSVGATLTLLADAVVGNEILLANDLVVDLNGHTLTRSTYGFLFRAASGSHGGAVLNGRCVSGASGITVGVQASSAPIAFTNCTLEARALFHGEGLAATLSGCRTVSDYFVSRESTGTIHVDGGAHAVRVARNNGYATAAKLSVTGGRFGFDVTDSVVDGYAQVSEDVVVDGVACRYAVYPATDVANYPGAVAFSADGTQSNVYVSVAEAIAACPENGRVRMLKCCKVAGAVSVPRSMKLDMNGLRFENTGGDFLKIGAGATLDVDGGGGTLQSGGSIFHMAAGASTLNVTNCVLKGNCPLYGGSQATANFYAGTFVANMSLMASGNGAATLNIYGGHYQCAAWRDNMGNLSTGTRLHIYGGRCAGNPTKGRMQNTDLIAAGHRAFYEAYTYRDQYFNHVVRSDAETASWTIEALWEGVAYTNVNTALSLVGAWKGTVQLQADIAHQTQFTLPDGEAGAATLDLNGHRIAVASDVLRIGKNKTLTLSGGALVPSRSSTSGIVLQENTRLTADATVSIVGPAGLMTCGFYVPGPGLQAVLDGTSVSTTYMFSWPSSGVNNRVTVSGDGTNTCSGIFWPGTSLPASSSLTIRGGWWKVNPTAYVTNNHVVLHREGVSPCPWRVRDWAKLTTTGWDFDLADPMLGATATGTLAAGTVEVSLKGTIPLRKTLLADLSAATVSGGALTFTKAPDLPNDVKVVYENGRLYAWQAKGTLMVIR